MSTNHILLTGLPGVGKTTLIKKAIEKLKNSNIDVNGFYTEEIRNESRKRIGFDVVTLDGKRGKLARITELVPSNEQTKFKVGQYVVFTKEFERLVLPIFKTNGKILILDEIGKMELFSNDFKKCVEEAFKSEKVIFATVPVPKGRSLLFVDTIKNNPKCCLFTVERTNRDALIDEVFQKILELAHSN